MGITFTNQKCVRNVKKTIETSESFAIGILNTLIDCELPWLTTLYNEVRKE